MTPPIFDDAFVDSLFPAPIFPAVFTSPASPTSNAGITPESTAALRRLLIENHKRFHVFFNDKGFRNHVSHHLFAAYGIGAPARILQRTFDDHASYQRPAYLSPAVITRENWTKHLGNEDFYNAYMNFFGTEIRKHGLPSTFEKYVLSHDVNWGLGEPRMLDRFISGMQRSLELKEWPWKSFYTGLAQAAVHSSLFQNLFDSSCFPIHMTNTVSDSIKGQPYQDRVHSFTILSRILEDDRLKAGEMWNEEMHSRSREVLKSTGGIIREYALLWTIREDEKDIQERVEELNWLVTLLFGVGGWKNGKAFRADFVFAHFVTSNVFLPSILSLLKPSHQIDLLWAYFASTLLWFVVQGRPDLDIEGFFQSVTSNPKPDLDPQSSNPTELNENPWLIILAHTIRHPDVHQVKAARALAQGAALYGARPKGYFAHTELKGTEQIDGTLFVRTGGLLMDALKWNHEKVRRVGGVDRGSGWDFGGLL